MNEKIISNAILFNKANVGKFHSACPLANIVVDYKDTDLLKHYLSESGRILPRRLTNVSAKKQRELKKAIKRAREIGLLPFAIV